VPSSLLAQLFTGPTNEFKVWDALYPVTQHQAIFHMMEPTASNHFVYEGWPRLGDNAQLTLGIFGNDTGAGSAIDTGATPTLPWDPTTAIGVNIALPQQTTGGGLTTDQDQALTRIDQSTSMRNTLDALTLIPLSPPGGGPGPFNAQLTQATAGTLVRMTRVAAELVPNTPDGDYWLPSLAVIRLFRGDDLWKRMPVHTSSKLYYWYDENVIAQAVDAVLTQWLEQISVQVTFRDGCEGEVFLLRFP
jgi:hypothetical protein